MGHKSKKNNHIRSRSHHIPQTQIKNTASSPHLFPDIDHLNITPSDLEKIFDDGTPQPNDRLEQLDEKKEEDEPLFFRPLSRSISFDSETRVMSVSPTNPFMTFIASTNEKEIEDDNVFFCGDEDEHSS